MKEKSIKLNAVLNVMKTVLSLVFPLITFPYITRVLQVNAIGKYDFSVSVISYFSLIAALGITTYAVREGTKYRGDQEKMNQFASEIFSINLYATIVSYILLFLALMFVDKLKSYNIVIGILSLEILLATLSVVWIYNIYEDFGYITFITFVLQFVSIILMLLFVHSADDLYKYVIISVISSSGSGLFMFFHARKYVQLHLVKKPPLKHLKPIMIVFSTTIAATIYISSDTTILGWLTDDYHVGIYGTAAKIYKIVKQVLNAVVAVVIPRFAFYIGTQEKDKILQLGRKLIDYMVAICCPAMVGLFCLSKPIVEEFAGASFSEAYIPLQLLSIALVFAVFANFFSNCVLISYKKEKIVMFATILSAVINIVLNFILIPRYQESAAAFTTIIAEVCVCVISAYESRKIIKINCTARNLISTIIGCVGIMICCMLAAKVIENQIYLILVSVIVSGLVYAVVLILMKNTVITDVLERFVRGARG